MWISVKERRLVFYMDIVAIITKVVNVITFLVINVHYTNLGAGWNRLSYCPGYWAYGSNTPSSYFERHN
jgi:hypothetical protein